MAGDEGETDVSESQQSEKEQGPISLQDWGDSGDVEIVELASDDEERITLNRADFDYLINEREEATDEVERLKHVIRGMMDAGLNWLSARDYWRRPYDMFALVRLGRAEAELERVIRQQELTEAQS